MITELAKRAGLHVDPDGEIGPAYMGSVDAGYRKFAELIVKETIAEFMQQMWKRGIDHTNDPTFYVAMKSTRETFGVEE